MSPESKMDAEICFRHSVYSLNCRLYRISSFSKRLFRSFLFCFYNIFIEIKNSIWLPEFKMVVSMSFILLKNQNSKYNYQLCWSWTKHLHISVQGNLFCLQLQPVDLHPRLQPHFVSSKIAVGAAWFVVMVGLYCPMSNIQPKSIGSPTILETEL
jgi:hypothetical protein